MQSPQRGFTLIELSVVLVIIGLIVGGILAGRTLIRSAELRGVVTEYNQFITATQTFKLKYGALPGDMMDATRIWGAANADPATCAITPSTNTLTCNGDGDEKIYPVLDTVSNESFRYWQQLSNAGLIAGKFDGITHGANGYSATLANSPQGRIPGTIWFIWNWPYPQVASAAFFDGEYGNRFSVGNVTPDSGPGGSLFNPSELYNIDLKIDDGKPGRGKVMTRWFGGCTLAVDSTDLNAAYAITTKDYVCTILLPNAF